MGDMTLWLTCPKCEYRSTKNVRIERLWVEVGTQVARRWKAFFTQLESRHGLDESSPEHRWVLQKLFLESINDEIEAFQEEWNSHPISGRPGNRTPAVSVDGPDCYCRATPVMYSLSLTSCLVHRECDSKA